MCSCEEDWKWTSSTLCRTSLQANEVLKRSLVRNFDYPATKLASKSKTKRSNSSLDDAFSSVMNSLSQCSNKCIHYYQHSDPRERNSADKKFCARYLPPSKSN